MIESILITGANAGLGKETARQFALRDETRKVILFCRNQARAEAAKKDLEVQTGKRIFSIVIGDVTDADSVRRAVEDIKEPIDAVVLNAGGVIGKTAAITTPSGMNQLAATNILGNVILVDELIKQDKLRKAVLAVSAEAVPGVKMLGVKPVSMRTSSVDEFAAVLDGSYFRQQVQCVASIRIRQVCGNHVDVIHGEKVSQAQVRCCEPRKHKRNSGTRESSSTNAVHVEVCDDAYCLPIDGRNGAYARRRCKTFCRRHLG